MKSLLEFATRLQVTLERVKKGQSLQLGAAIEAMIKEGTYALSALGKDSQDAAKLEQMIRKLKKQQRKTLGKAVSTMKQDLEQLSLWQQDTEAKFLTKGLKAGAKAAGKKLVKDKVIKQLAKKELLDNILARTMQATGEQLDPFLDGWSERQIDALWQRIRQAKARGATVDQITDIIEGTEARRKKDGHVAKSKMHAETVARTATQHISTATRAELYVENDDVVEGYIFIATLDDVTSATCQSLDRQEFELEKGPLPPMHPNCRSTTIPKLSKVFDFLDEGATRSSEGGYVDSQKTYYQWLSEQSDSAQLHILGKRAYAVFNMEGMTPEKFRKLRLNKEFKPVTIAELEKLSGFVIDDDELPF